MKTIREMWNEQADEYNQFHELDKKEVELFANEIIRLFSCKRCVSKVEKFIKKREEECTEKTQN